MDREQFQKIYGNIVAKAWVDDAFKQRLLSDPNTVLKEDGIDDPDGVQFNVLESTANLIHLILPPRPDSSELTAEGLENRQAAVYTDPDHCTMCVH